MEHLFTLLWFGIGIILGALFLWLLGRARIRQVRETAMAERSAETATLTERLSAREEQVRALQGELERAGTEEQRLREEHTGLKVELSELRTRAEADRRSAQEKLALLEDARQQLGDAFRALSAEALDSNNRRFLHLARTALEKFQEGARTDLSSRQEAIHQLVTPLKDSLTKVDSRINELEKAREGAYQRLDQQLRSLLESQVQLQSETGKLVNALRKPTVRGRWGEIQLRRVVEMAGMVNFCDFVEQETSDGEAGRLRPDLVVKLPNGKNIIVDAKAPLQAYLEALESEDEALRQDRLQAHARQIRDHLQKLSAKNYWDQFEPTPEFVVLFLPGETFFAAALEQDPGLIEYGVDKRVLLATPTTLIALLRAVAYGWRQEQLAENAAVISQLGRELYDRLATLSGHFAGVGKGLERAVEGYNRAVSSLDSRVLVTARKFKELGAYSGKELDAPAPVEKTARSIDSPEDT